jgi:hypothetical protein
VAGTAARSVDLGSAQLPPGRRAEIVLAVHVRAGADDAAVPSGALLGRASVVVHEVADAFGGEVVAVLGERVLAVFPLDQAVDAITAGVEIQRDATRSGGGEHAWSCAVCLVAGDAADDPAFERIRIRPVGAAADRAVLRAVGAQAGAVVVDETTALAAARRRKRSSTPAEADQPDAIGSTLGWSLGEQRLLLDGDQPMSSYEIDFEAHTAARAARVAVSTSSGTRGGRGPRGNQGGRRGRGAGREGRSGGGLRRRPWSQGRVFCWFSDRGRGVITSTTGQEFYVDRRFLAVGSELAAGDRVYFVPRDPVARGRNPVAGAVLGEGARLEVRIERAGEDGSALALVSDSNGTDQVLPVDTSPVGPVAAGEWLLVRITGRDTGPVGVPV